MYAHVLGGTGWYMAETEWVCSSLSGVNMEGFVVVVLIAGCLRKINIARTQKTHQR